MSLPDEIRTFIRAHRDDYTRLLQDWVRDATLSGQEAAHQAKIRDLYQSLGLDTDYWEVDIAALRDNPLFNSHRQDFTGSPNVVGTWKGSGGGRSLILNGHVDVVPEGDHAQWEQPPYSGEILDGCLYGRGVTDMKGGNMASFIAVSTLKSLGVKLKGDVILQSVIEEEAGGAGTLAALERGYRADAALIPEPSEQMIFPRQQGSRWFRLRVVGIKAHGGTRYEGVSALEKAMSVLEALQELEKRRNDELEDPLYDGVPIPLPINVGRIAGGDWPSSVPDEITLEGRVGVGPGETVADAQRDVESALAALAERDSWFGEHPVDIEWFGACWQPGGIATDDPLLDMLSTAYREVHGESPRIQASPWGTDGGLMTQYGIPALVFGPGITRLAHFPNEHIRLDDVFDVAEIIALAVLRWCGHDE
ncbi:peptidase [Halomonas elongata]|uniref:Homolog to acetylornithine deacetylase n=1 Tax=Halomonas elongata (strain ATCC 33173 / DSM 2581 / NBRC 15536 / NCIMB 2198 / 1H9) TaxID=768066 RepID=E1V5J2_HALED|nr:peptidase [Halomonas elongata]MDL4863088.1 peptidase [Halomonas elongata]WBF16887.1 peptidase [Halomonas elongata]WPU45718.1 peptidase [Halomonas elongata DSM 2581]CBV43147.1 homolog to acetylornithine deacetylase [Halomonas elongata DSM 2581]